MTTTAVRHRIVLRAATTTPGPALALHPLRVASSSASRLAVRRASLPTTHALCALTRRILRRLRPVAVESA
jgi:hypothetical protein